MTGSDRYQRLRDALAAGPTPGVRRISDDGRAVIDDTGGAILSRRPDGCSSRLAEREQQQAANVMLAAAADPETIAALLKERDALREALHDTLMVNETPLGNDITAWADAMLRARQALEMGGDDAPQD